MTIHIITLVKKNADVAIHLTEWLHWADFERSEILLEKKSSVTTLNIEEKFKKNPCHYPFHYDVHSQYNANIFHVIKTKLNFLKVRLFPQPI